MAGNLMFFIDFDGTISKEDVCAGMVKKFAREGWEEFNRLWEEGVLSTEECAARTFELMTVKPGELTAFFDTMEVDPAFPAFVEWVKNNQWSLYILSDGYDNYIQPILNRYGLDLPYFANHLEYEKGWHIACGHLDIDCGKCGVCKTKLIKDLIKPQYTTIYIGDGYSDLCPAEYCDVVLAKKDLACLCQKKGISYFPYEDFHDVQRIIQGLMLP